MTRLCLPGALALAQFVCGQRTPQGAPSAPVYTPPTHQERFQSYVAQTYGIGSFAEAGIHAAIDQARHQPSGWSESGVGYVERYGSAFGEIVVRGSMEYGLAEIFREDIRYLRRDAHTSKFKAALEDTFTARKGKDGHHAFSVARLVGPISGSFVATTWKPGGSVRDETVEGIAITYGLVFVRNLIRELSR